MAENYKYSEEGGKLWLPKLEIPNAKEKLDMSAQLLPLLLLKSYSASAPSHVSIYSTQPNSFFGLCGSREFVLTHSAKYP